MACTAEPLPCSGLATLEDFLGCEELCSGWWGGSPACPAGGGEQAVALLEEEGPELLEYTPADSSDRHPLAERLVGLWELGELDGPDGIEILGMPGRVPSTRPAIAVRSVESEHPVVTFAMRATGGQGTCVVALGIVATWIVVPAWMLVTEPNLLTRYLVLDASGDCPDDVVVGAHWSREGFLLMPQQVGRPSGGDVACGVDGLCIEWCRVDYDCPCHRDGECDPAACIGDRECGCIADGICMPGCDDDPDCACVLDGACNPACLSLDPDCPCEEDGCCSFECLASDPDCGCAMDGSCSMSPCGWFDPDCRLTLVPDPPSAEMSR
jgi:hypothetical protein